MYILTIERASSIARYYTPLFFDSEGPVPRVPRGGAAHGPGYRLKLLIGICKGAVRLGPPPTLTVKLCFFYFFSKFIFLVTLENKVVEIRGENRIWG